MPLVPRPRVAATTLAAAAVAAVLAVGRPDDPAKAWADLVDYGENARRVDASRAEGRAIDAELLHADACSALRKSWLDDLAAGRSPLREVVRLYIEADHASPWVVSGLERGYPGASVEEKTARKILEHLATRLKDVPARTGARDDARRQFEATYGAGHAEPTAGEPVAALRAPARD